MPERTCIGCRATDDQAALVRLVAVDGQIVLGTNPRLPGRGAYFHEGCVGLVVRRRALARAFGGLPASAELQELLRTVDG